MLRGVQRPGHVLRAGHVPGDEDGPAAEGLQGRPAALLAAAEEDGDDAGGQQPFGDGEAEAGGAAGDERGRGGGHQRSSWGPPGRRCAERRSVMTAASARGRWVTK